MELHLDCRKRAARGGLLFGLWKSFPPASQRPDNSLRLDKEMPNDLRKAAPGNAGNVFAGSILKSKSLSPTLAFAELDA
jgi:hypothetical protein